MPRETSSPFTPGVPISPEFFVGRQDQIKNLKRKVQKAVSTGRPQTVFVTGERGIGKSSLAGFVRSLAEIEYQTLGVVAQLTGSQSVDDVVQRIFDRLVKRYDQSGWFGAVRDWLGKSVRKAGMFSISLEFAPPATDLRRLVTDFPGALQTLLDKVKDHRKGIVIVLDDINGLATSADFCNWFKSVIDEVGAMHERLPVCFLLVGIPERRDSMVALQPSLDRILDIEFIDTWQESETISFFRTSFAKAGITCSESLAEVLARYAGGLPVLAHEIGDATFYASGGEVLSGQDAVNGIRKAAEIVGQKYLEPNVMNGLRSKRYRNILSHLAKSARAFEFTRAEVLKSLPDEEGSVLDNFLKKMTTLGVISKNTDEGPGAYRFTNRLHYTYFWMQADPTPAIPATPSPGATTGNAV